VGSIGANSEASMERKVHKSMQTTGKICPAPSLRLEQ